MIRQTPGGVELDLYVVPRSRSNRIDGQRAGRLVVRLTAPPVDGAANDALVDILGQRLNVRRAEIRIVAGARGRFKRVCIAGVSADVVRTRLLPG